MDKKISSTNKGKAFLSKNIGNFANFVNQVIHNEEFLKCVRNLLPFDGEAYASMNIVSEKQVVRKMGVLVMLMDKEPSLFSLAVTITTDRGNKEKKHDIIVFLTVCKSIEALQEYISGKRFREDVVEQCGNYIL